MREPAGAWIIAVTILTGTLGAEDWPRFRGPNGSGVSLTSEIPATLGDPLYRIGIGTGHSSPVIVGDRLYLTALEDDRLFTLCLRRTDGRLLWKRECPRPRKEILDKRNNAASPSAVADAKAVYVFFPEFGVLSYTPEGKERWRVPLGPFDNFYGMGASPILAAENVILVCDQTKGSYAIALNQADGKVRWKVPRAEMVSGHSTPVLYQPSKGGPLQVVAPGSFRMDSYQASTGEIVWFAQGLASEMKSVPLVSGDTVFINGYNLPENDPGRQVNIQPFREMLQQDANKDGFLSKDEMSDGRAKSFFEYLDLDHDKKLSLEEWQYFERSMAAENALLALQPGKTVWRYHRSIPQLPSTLLYDDVLYMISDGGILTTLDPATGTAYKQARLRTASDRIFASPVAAGGKLVFVTQAGVVVMVKAGREHEVLSVKDLGEEAYATPAIADNRLYIRTTQALYAFGSKETRP